MLEARYGSSTVADLKVPAGTAWAFSHPEKKILVYVPALEDGQITKVKNETVQLLYSLMESQKTFHAILIYNEIAPHANELLTTHQVYRVEMFKHRLLLFDPTRHEKYSPHHKMTPEQVSQELPGVKISQLPSLLESDRIVRYFDWPIGSVIRIDRFDGPYYRLVVHG